MRALHRQLPGLDVLLPIAPRCLGWDEAKARAETEAVPGNPEGVGAEFIR